jgi:2-phosphosulfolactate phosphatase
VIDVFRAFSVACYLVNKGVEAIYPVADIEIAYRLKRENPSWILVGERNERRPEGFDYGNSPSQFANDDLRGRTVVHTTSSGTQGLLAATRNAHTILTGSLVNADAIVRFIKTEKYPRISLCCMGYATRYPTEEDTLCAEYIKAHLTNNTFDLGSAREIIRKTSGQRFFEGHEHAPESDFHACLQAGMFNFVLRAREVSSGVLKLEKIPV